MAAHLGADPAAAARLLLLADQLLAAPRLRGLLRRPAPPGRRPGPRPTGPAGPAAANAATWRSCAAASSCSAATCAARI